MVTPSEDSAARPLWLRVLIGLGAFFAVLGAALLLLYNFGGMGGSALDPQIGQQYEQLVRSGQTMPVERRFVIPIPGCTCHSTDPRLTEEHRYHRIKECRQSGCHG